MANISMVSNRNTNNVYGSSIGTNKNDKEKGNAKLSVLVEGEEGAGYRFNDKSIPIHAGINGFTYLQVGKLDIKHVKSVKDVLAIGLLSIISPEGLYLSGLDNFDVSVGVGNKGQFWSAAGNNDGWDVSFGVGAKSENKYISSSLFVYVGNLHEHSDIKYDHDAMTCSIEHKIGEKMLGVFEIGGEYKWILSQPRSQSNSSVFIQATPFKWAGGLPGTMNKLGLKVSYSFNNILSASVVYNMNIN